MNTRAIAGDWAAEVPHSLSERIARFAMAINGCSAQNARKACWEKAKQELASKPANDSNDAVLESAPESECWHPVPGLTGYEAPVVRQGLQAG
jgi:hypothetical protein